MPSPPRHRWLNRRIRAGLAFLILASLWRWLVHPGPRLTSDLADGISGVLYGISIGCVLSGLRANALRGVARRTGHDEERA